MKITDFLSDDAILAEFGLRIVRRRLELQLTQADLAEQAGVAKRTLERIESGASAQMSSIIRILRALGGLEGLDRMILEAIPSPMDLLKRTGSVRKRASKSRRQDRNEKPWLWDDKT